MKNGQKNTLSVRFYKNSKKLFTFVNVDTVHRAF